MAERRIPDGVMSRLGIGEGLTLVQIPYSPFCISIRTALEAGGVPHAVHDLALWDRRAVTELTGGAYYAVPVLADATGPAPLVIYESRDDGMEIAAYVDGKYALGLFPDALAGLHDIVVQYVESQLEDTGFRLGDIHVIPRVDDVVSRTMTLRHKERKFGKGCLEQWRAQAPALQARFEELLLPLDRMLARHRFLLADRPAFADYALFGVLGNYLYSGDNRMPAGLAHLGRWHAALPGVQLKRPAPAATR
jgi:glutathione S-transferase